MTSVVLTGRAVWEGRTPKNASPRVADVNVDEAGDINGPQLSHGVPLIVALCIVGVVNPTNNVSGGIHCESKLGGCVGRIEYRHLVEEHGIRNVALTGRIRDNLKLDLEVDRLGRDLLDLKPAPTRQLSQHALHFLLVALFIVLVLVFRRATHSRVLLTVLLLDLKVLDQRLVIVDFLQFSSEMIMVVRMTIMRVTVMPMKCASMRFEEKNCDTEASDEVKAVNHDGGGLRNRCNEDALEASEQSISCHQLPSSNSDVPERKSRGTKKEGAKNELFQELVGDTRLRMPAVSAPPGKFAGHLNETLAGHQMLELAPPILPWISHEPSMFESPNQ
jgi:hypothetical protein